MYRNINDFKSLGTTNINCLLTDGGLGDMVASTVAVNYIIKNYKHINLLVWVPDYFLEYCKALLPGVTIRNFTNAKTNYNPSLPSISTRWNGRHSGMKSSLVGYAFHMLCDMDEPQENQYLQLNLKNIKNLVNSNKYVVITTGFTANNRQFLPQYINEIIKYSKSKDYEIVFLGKKEAVTGTKHLIKGTFSEEINFQSGINLIDKTTLLQAAKIMSESKAVIGLDNGLLHVAANTQATIVAGYTNVDPKARIPNRPYPGNDNYYTVVPPESLGCRFCQSKMNFMYGHDFKECFYKDFECTKQLKPELWINQLEKIL